MLLDADPLSDIANTRKINAVVLNGQLISSQEIHALLASVSNSRWRPDGSGLTFLRLLLGRIKFLLLGVLAVLTGIMLFVRRTRRRRRLSVAPDS